MVETKKWETVQVEFPTNKDVCQGDIIRDVEYIEEAEEVGDFIKVSMIIYPYTIVMTQACDLQRDFVCRNKSLHDGKRDDDKRLVSALVLPVYNADHLFEGTHLSKLKLEMYEFGSSSFEVSKLGSNQLPRYHVLRFDGQAKVPDSIIDFKHYFSVSIPTLEKKKASGFVCQVSPLWRESISQRFSNYLARIGLPEATQSGTARAPRHDSTPDLKSQ